ncbi:MAG TPA: Nramp family divalent metal transporter, partial [Schlesneria sp.]
MTDSPSLSATSTDFVPPHPGSQQMPQWDGGELPDAPVFRLRNWTALIGPSMVMAAAAIGGGEWLTGPLVTAKYGGALLWLSTLSILGQVFYNIEISRYTLYTGEPIFTGKFRTLPGPMFWLAIYLVLDCGSFLPYLASNAAIPAAALYLGRLPIPSTDSSLLSVLSCVIFLALLLPLTIGGKVYNSLKAIMTFKLVVVMGFLIFLAVFYSKASTWTEICSGFVKFGTVPVIADEDVNANGVQDPGEEKHVPKLENIATSWGQGRLLPKFDLSMIGILVSMIAISGNGGLTNTPISNFTREQGWGMGRHVGAIPSIVGGHAIELSHVGMVFKVTQDSLARWGKWVRHIEREQFWLWMPACFLGLALPSMLSVQFLPRGTELKDKYQAAAMTADGVGNAVGGPVITTESTDGTAPQV